MWPYLIFIKWRPKWVSWGKYFVKKKTSRNVSCDHASHYQVIAPVRVSTRLLPKHMLLFTSSIPPKKKWPSGGGGWQAKSLFSTSELYIKKNRGTCCFSEKSCTTVWRPAHTTKNRTKPNGYKKKWSWDAKYQKNFFESFRNRSPTVRSSCSRCIRREEGEGGLHII